MKKKVLWAAVALMTAIGFGACSSDDGNDDVIWDIYPVKFSFSFTDSDGNDMLDSTYQGNIIKDVSVTYKDEEYPVVTLEEYERKMREQATTRMYAARFMGLILRETTSLEGHHHFYMTFGEFDGMENVDWREITLNLPNDQHINLAYTHSYTHYYGHDPEIYTQFYMNGQALSDDKGGKYGLFQFLCSQTGYFQLISDFPVLSD